MPLRRTPTKRKSPRNIDEVPDNSVSIQETSKPVKSRKGRKENNNFCALCNNLIVGDFVSCLSCQKNFDLECAGISRKVFEEKDKIKSWTCDLNCKLKINSKEPVSEEKIINLDQNQVLLIINDLQSQLKILSESLNCLSNKYDELLAINSKLNEENQNLKASSSANLTNNRNCSDDYINEINDLKQYNIRKNIIIKGIKLTENDDPMIVFLRIANFLNSTINDSYIEDLKVRFDKNNKFSTILVKFCNFGAKKLFTGCRKGKKISPSDIGFTGMKNIIIEDELTRANQDLLRESKTILKKYNFKFIWILNGRVCFKLDEKSSYYFVKSMKNLAEIEKDLIRNY